jgi:AhpC/TSA family
MRFVAHVVGPLAILLVAPASGMMDSTPAEELARLKKEVEAAWGELDSVQKPGATEAEQKAAYDRYSKQAAALARRALALAEAHPDAPEALEALIWILDQVKTADECDAAYDLMARRHLDKDSLLPIIRTAWNEAPSTAHVEAFLRAAVERSPNLKVKSLSCFSLGRHQQELAWFARVLNHPIRGKRIEEQLGPEKSHRLRSIKPEALEREAEALFERTIKEYADVRPMKDFPPLGEQAEAALFQMRNLEIGCTIPEIGGEDVDGKPMKLSDYRGKVVVITFWGAEWTCIATRAVSRCAGHAQIASSFAVRWVGFPSSAWARQIYLLPERTLEPASDGAPGTAVGAADFTRRRVGDRPGAAVHVFSSFRLGKMQRSAGGPQMVENVDRPRLVCDELVQLG